MTVDTPAGTKWRFWDSSDQSLESIAGKIEAEAPAIPEPGG
jgi:hypothetical protein